MPSFERHPTLKHYQSKGFSMEPFLFDGDTILVDENPNAVYRPGDILLYRNPAMDVPIAHRFISLSKEGRYVLRADYDLRVESIPPQNIRGRVVQVFRNDRVIFKWRPSPYLFQTYRITTIHPFMLRISQWFGKGLLPFVDFIQNTNLYSRSARAFFNTPMRVEVITQNAIHRFAAYHRNRYAGSVCAASLNDNGKGILWVSSLYVRIRYRKIGVSTQLLKGVETFGKKNQVKELWLSFDSSDWGLKQFYQKQGYRPAEKNRVLTIRNLGYGGSREILWKKELILT